MGDPIFLPQPGWLTARPIETAETFADSPIVIPESVRDGVAKWQYLVVASGGPAPVKRNEITGKHEPPGIPHSYQPEDWILTGPRVGIQVWGDLHLIPERDVWAVIREVVP